MKKEQTQTTIRLMDTILQEGLEQGREKEYKGFLEIHQERVNIRGRKIAI